MVVHLSVHQIRPLFFLPRAPSQENAKAIEMLRSVLFALFVLPSAALQVSTPSSRRQAVASAARLVPGLVLLPQIAHADAIEDIATRNNAIAAKQREAKAKAKASGPGFVEQAANGVAGVAVPAIGAAIVGGVVLGFSQQVGQSGVVADVAENLKEKRRPLTEAEKRKYKSLSAKEKADLGIKGL